MGKFKSKIQIGILVLLILFVAGNFISISLLRNSNQESGIQKLDSTIETENSNRKIQIKKATEFYPLSDYELWLVESIVAGESGNQEYWGKVGVASCILNACLKDDIRPEEVQNLYGYSGWYDIDKYSKANPGMAEEVKLAVHQVFFYGQVLSTEILWFYNPALTYSSFHESQTHVITIGDHKFFAPN